MTNDLVFDPVARVKQGNALELGDERQEFPACQRKPSDADPAPNHSAAPIYDADGCPALGFTVQDPHQGLVVIIQHRYGVDPIPQSDGLV